MAKGKAFILVGHSHWGKSLTLRQLTKGTKKGWWEIKDNYVFIKRMSNDDIPESVINFVDNLDSEYKNVIIMTLCPNFEEENHKTKYIINKVEKNYKMYFFVLKQSYNDDRTVTDDEIEELRKHGNVEILQKREKDKQRAIAFNNFIIKYI